LGRLDGLVSPPSQRWSLALRLRLQLLRAGLLIITVARPKWRDVSLWRGLSHGISKDDVKRILGEPGKVADLGGMIIWYYGYPSGGQVTFGQDGRLES